MIIDSHERLMLPTELQLKKMDEAGVDKTILFCSAPHPKQALDYSEFKNEMNKLYTVLAGSHTKEQNIQRFKKNINDFAQVLQNYPDRFYGFGSVPLDLTIQGTKEWIQIFVISNGLKGIGEFTPGSDEQMSKLEEMFFLVSYLSVNSYRKSVNFSKNFKKAIAFPLKCAIII